MKKKRRIAIHHPDCITVKETTARQKREEKNFGEYVCVRTRHNLATEHCEASSHYFALAPVSQLYEVVSLVNNSIKLLI